MLVADVIVMCVVVDGEPLKLVLLSIIFKWQMLLPLRLMLLPIMFKWQVLLPLFLWQKKGTKAPGGEITTPHPQQSGFHRTPQEHPTWPR